MSRRVLSIIPTLVLCAILALGQRQGQLLKAAGSPVDPKVPIAWNRYYDAKALEALSYKIAKAHPHLAEAHTIGKSQQGRNIWCLTITDFTKGDSSRKPAIYLQGNIHGNEIQGAEVALYTAWYLTETFQDNGYIQELLADKAFYIVPTLNPDARDYFFHHAVTQHNPRGYPRSSDRAARDLDGNGSISRMRVRNPHGIYRIDPTNPDKMVRLGEKEIENVNGVDSAKRPDSRNYDVLPEGGVDPFDGTGADNGRPFTDHDDPNRNWSYGWTPEESRIAERSGFSFTFVETRVARDFFYKHPNIAAAESFHNSGGSIGPAELARQPTDPIDAEMEKDIALYDQLGAHVHKVLPEYRYDNSAIRVVRVIGKREVDWMFGKHGAYSFVVELMPHTADNYDFNKDLLFGDAFVPWRSVNDPTRGTVEVGGFKKNFPRLTPGFLLEEEAHRNMAFAVYVCRETPTLRIDYVRSKEIGNGLREIYAVVTNTSLMPTHSSSNARYAITRADYVTLESSVIMSIERMEAPQGPNGVTITTEEHNPRRYEINNIPGHSTVTLRWIVSGSNGPFTITVDSVKGGVASASTKGTIDLEKAGHYER